MSGALTSKNGFSVVAPMSTTSRSSTACRSASCCDFGEPVDLVDEQDRAAPWNVRRSRAASIALRMSATPEETAETSVKAALVVLAMTRARLVFPQPAGP